MVGVDAKNKDILDPRFICRKCSLIIRDPVQLSQCGHRLCQTCVDAQHRATIKCPDCSEETPRTELMIDQSFRREIQSLPIECSFCDWIGVLNGYESHIKYLHSNQNCNNCGEQFDSVHKLNEHRELRCQKITGDCLLKEFGCEEPIVRCNKKEHYDSDRHQEVLEKNLRQIQLLEDAERKSSVGVDTDLPQTPSVMAVDPNISRFQELLNTLNTMQASFNELKISSDNRQQSLNDTLLQCQQNYPIQDLDFFQTKSSVEEANKLSNENINDMPVASAGGTSIWKITKFHQQMSDAQSERQTSIYSPPFYSSPSGYKMRARLYLYGDGNARRTHMSLFFVLMRGPNDSVLKFPFNYKVTFCLYDQSVSQRHIIDSFRPDIRSNSFQRPRSEMNIASGIPKFFPLAMIQQEGNPYVQKDTIYIKIMVDFVCIPNTLLPYALSLNPGIPTQIQQIVIRQEAERRARQQARNDQ